jgi:hypothetical protein
MPVIPTMWEKEGHGQKQKTFSEKITKARRLRGLAQVVECKTLNSKAHFQKKKRAIIFSVTFSGALPGRNLLRASSLANSHLFFMLFCSCPPPPGSPPSLISTVQL